MFPQASVFLVHGVCAVLSTAALLLFLWFLSDMHSTWKRFEEYCGLAKVALLDPWKVGQFCLTTRIKKNYLTKSEAN